MEKMIKFTAVLGLLVLCGSAAGMEGSGTETDPYVITNVEQLQAMRDDLGAWYVLGNDIDATDTVTWNGGAGFEAVGSEANSFTGTLDGQGHVITGLYINRPSDGEVGLFGIIRDGAELKNVGLADVNMTGFRCGSLAAASRSSTIYRAWSSGTVRGTSPDQHPMGGLVGANTYDSLLSQCFSSVDVYANYNRAGGLAGLNNKGSIIIDCYAIGDVSGKYKLGGLVGDNTWGSYGGYIKNCYSVGKVTGSGGGLVGFNWQGGVTYDSYWDVETSGKTTSYGGTPKTTAEMMQEATFVDWDFNDIWYIEENETYPALIWELDGLERIIIYIKNAIGEKELALISIEAALEKEWSAYGFLEELFESRDYGDLKNGDIAKARQKVYSVIQHEEQAANTLERSIDKLYESLFSLGWEPPAEE